MFGAAVVGKTIEFLSWEVVLYALLSLTLVRMAPVFLTLTGSNPLTGESLRGDEKLFMGWFGPRGLASVVFAVIVLNEAIARRRHHRDHRGLHRRAKHRGAWVKHETLGRRALVEDQEVRGK